jgi:hypothetical protein
MRQSQDVLVFLRIQAQTERLYHRAAEDFERIRKLRKELANQPIFEPEPEETKPVDSPKNKPTRTPRCRLPEHPRARARPPQPRSPPPPLPPRGPDPARNHSAGFSEVRRSETPNPGCRGIWGPCFLGGRVSIADTAWPPGGARVPPSSPGSVAASRSALQCSA